MDPNESTPVAEPTVVAPNVSGEIPAPVQDDDADPDSLAVEVERPGGKVSMVPLPALKQARERARTAKEEAKAAADKATQLEQQLGAAAPILQMVRNNPALLEAVQTGRQPSHTEPTQDDKDAAEMAEILQLYRQDGTLDIVAGKRALAVQDRRSQAQLQPVQQATASRDANANYQWALTATDAKGRPYARPETIRRVFTEFVNASPDGMKLASDRRVAQTILNQARAEDVDWLMSTPQPPASAPIFSEVPGGRFQQDEGLTAQEDRARKAMGVSEKDWKATTNRKGGLWAPFEQ